MAAASPADLEGIYDDLYNIESGRAALDRRNAVFKFQSPAGVTQVTDLEEQRRRRRKKQASRDRAPGVQFTHARAPSIHPPTQMSQQRPNELKYLYSLPIQTPRAPELPRSSSRSNSNNGKNRRRRPRSERASRTRTSQIQRDRDRSRGRSARAAPSPPPPARTLPAEHSPAPRGEQPPRRSRTTPNRLHRHPRQSDAATQADMYDSDSGSEPGNRLQQESTRVDSVQHFTSSSVHHTNGSPHVDDRRGSAKSGVLDRAQTHELPDFHNPQKQGSTPSPGSRAVMPQAGVNPEGSTLSSQLALQMILQTLTQGATGAPTVSGKNNVASPGLDMNNYNLDGILRNRVASVTHAPAAMHVEGAPVDRDFYSPGTISWSHDDGARRAQHGSGPKYISTQPPDLSPRRPDRNWYSGLPSTSTSDPSVQGTAFNVPVSAPTVHRSRLASRSDHSKGPEELLVQLCIESFRREATGAAEPTVPADELIRRHSDAVAEIAALTAEQKVSTEAANNAHERLRLELEKQKLEQESRLEVERQRLSLLHQQAAHQVEVLRSELHLKESALEAKAQELDKLERERQWAFEKSQLESKLRNEEKRLDTEVAQQRKQLEVFEKQVKDLCEHLKITTKAVSEKEADKERTVSELKAMHTLDKDHLKRRIRELQEECARRNAGGDGPSSGSNEPARGENASKQNASSAQNMLGTGSLTNATARVRPTSRSDENSASSQTPPRGTATKASSRRPTPGTLSRQSRPLLLHVRSNANVREAVESGDPNLFGLWGSGPHAVAFDANEGPSHNLASTKGQKDNRDDDDDDTEGLLLSSDDELTGAEFAHADQNDNSVHAGGNLRMRESIPLRPVPANDGARLHADPGPSAAVGGGFGLADAHRPARRQPRHHQQSRPIFRNPKVIAGFHDDSSSSFTLSESSGIAERLSFESEDTTELLEGPYGDAEADWSALSQELNDSSLDMPVSD